jgi:nicotinamidase-related amidase
MTEPPTCLLVVDMQERYRTSADGSSCAGVAEALRRARSCGMMVVHIQHDIDAADLVAMNSVLKYVQETHAQGYGEHHLVPLPCAFPAVGEKVVMKRTFDSFYRTQLHRLLKSAGIRRILICGLLTGMCVLSTTFSAFSRGYEVWLLRDATTDSDDRRYEVVHWVYPEISRVSSVAEALHPGDLPQPRLQQVRQHAPALLALPALGAPQPRGGALLILNASPLYMTPEQIQRVAALSQAYRFGGGVVYNVHTETSARGGTAHAFESLFHRPLEVQPALRTGPNIPVNVSSCGVFDNGLRDRIKERGIGQVALAGALSGLQVLHALLDAFNRQFWVVLVKDCMFDPQPQRRDVALDAYDGQLCTGLSGDELLETM